VSGNSDASAILLLLLAFGGFIVTAGSTTPINQIETNINYKIEKEQNTMTNIYANNYDNALGIYLTSGTTSTYIAQALTECDTYNLTAVRTWATGTGGESAAVYDMWKNNTALFWVRFDAFIALCKAQGVNLVINLGVAEFFTDEATGDLGNPASDVYALYVEWVTEICTRYSDETAIVMWECLNEYEWSGQPLNLAATFHNNAAAAIKAVDPHHLVCSGTGNWGYDSEAWQTVNAGANLDVASIHIYTDELTSMLGWMEGFPSLSIIQTFLESYVTLATAVGKTMYFGEVGGDVEYSGGVTSNPDDIRFQYVLQALQNMDSEIGFHSFASGSCTDTYAIDPPENPEIITLLSSFEVTIPDPPAPPGGVPIPLSSAFLLLMNRSR
jgi:hypothetical protein